MEQTYIYLLQGNVNVNVNVNVISSDPSFKNNNKDLRVQITMEPI